VLPAPIATAAAVSVAPSVPAMPTLVLVTDGLNVTFATAISPFAIRFRFRPYAMQTEEEGPGAQTTSLAAADAAEPVVIETDVTSEGLYVSCHWSAAGDTGELNRMRTGTVLLCGGDATSVSCD